MSKAIILGLIVAGSGVLASEAPEYVKHDKIKGSTQILVNTEAFVGGKVEEVKDYVDAKISDVANKSSNYVNSVERVLSGAISANAKAIRLAATKEELETLQVNLLENIRTKADKEDVVSADGNVLTNAMRYTDGVASNALLVVEKEANEIREDFTEAIASLKTVPVELPPAAESNGVTFVDQYGEDANVAISIGRNAKAGVTSNALETAASGTVVRSVSIAIGAESDATVSTNSTKNQAIAIGWHAQAKGSNAIAIGSGAEHPTETADTGDATYAKGSTTIAIGYSAKATEIAAIAIGNKARVNAENAVQLGAGTNTEKNTFKYQNVTIVKDGKIATTIDTNAVEKIVTDTLDSKVVTTAEPAMDVDARVVCQSHAITTLAFTNQTIGMEIGLWPTGSRNYEVYIPNTMNMREGLPISMMTEVDGAVTLDSWWTNKIFTLPAKIRIMEPIAKNLIAEVKLYNDNWDWTPIVVSAIATNGYVNVNGTNLHFVAKYQINDGEIKATTNPLYMTIVISEASSAGDVLKLYNAQDVKVAETTINLE